MIFETFSPPFPTFPFIQVSLYENDNSEFMIVPAQATVSGKLVSAPPPASNLAPA